MNLRNSLRRLVFPLAVTVCVWSVEGAGSEWVFCGPEGKLHYKNTPRGDRIMDFSTAGYMGGGVALPTVPVKKTVQPSGGDDTVLIQGALNEVAALPLQGNFRGAVLLGQGVFVCSNTLFISASGIVLRGSGSGTNGKATIIKMTGGKHIAIDARKPTNREQAGSRDAANSPASLVVDDYVPSGATSFAVSNPEKFAAGDMIEIQRPVTESWVKFMGMDNLTRNGSAETWLRAGSAFRILRRIASISGNRITMEVPLSDSFDAKYLTPPGTKVLRIREPDVLRQAGVEHLRIQSPPQAVNHTVALYSALRLEGEDCWARDLAIDETMNSVSAGGRRITLENVTVNRQARHQGASKPAEFAPNGDQILLDRCAVNADNVWFAATGTGHSGPIVLLNCAFHGDGHIEGHMRWTTGMLLDNCRLPDGGIDFKNRGEMGSGHGWGLGWSVAWNCAAKSFVVQQPPGAMNWAIGCVGGRLLMPRPFGKGPDLPEGTFDSHGTSVEPRSLYLAQLEERLGSNALRNIGYSSAQLLEGP